MALEVKEEVSAVIFYKNIDGMDAQESVAPVLEFQPVSCAMSSDSIMVDIEGIHSIITRNYTLYTPECLKKSAPYWTSPYERPVIMHHNDRDGVQIGRIKVAEYMESTRAKSPGLLFTCNIGDEAGIKGVKNGTLSTVSIGAVIHKATCSICGQNIAAEGECEHQRGRKYDDKLCYWIMEEMEPKELSYVIVPSDRYANTIKIYKPKNINSKESYNEGGQAEDMSVFDNIDLTKVDPEITEADNAGVKKDGIEDLKPEEPEKEDPKPEDPKPDEAEAPKPEEPKAPEEEPKKEEPKKEEPKKDEIEDMSKEELIDKVKEQNKQIAGLLDDIKYLKAKLDQERGLKENLELEILKMKKVNKMHLAEQIVDLRKELGLREESLDELMLLSEESLNSSIKTFMEFKESNSFNVKNLPKVESKAVVDDEVDNTIKEYAKVESNKNSSNIDYEQQLNNILKNLTSKKY
jgi:hypothetical protein